MMRRRRRRTRYRVGYRRRQRQRILQIALAATAAVALILAASVIIRSIRTARLNRSLVQIHTISGEEMQAMIAAPPIEQPTAKPKTVDPKTGLPEGLSLMGLPDGTPIEAGVAVIDRADDRDMVTSTVFHRTDLDMLPDMVELARRNQDTVGWLSVPGVLHLPVVYRDNTYYLTHDFNGALNKSGTLFLDQAHPLTEKTQNLLIHGHSMNDGSMFGLLTHYRRLDYLKQHGVISFSTLWEKDSYAVFAVLLVSSDAKSADYFNYFTHPRFASDESFDEYIDEVRERSLYSVPVDVEPGDALLTLSTCMDDDRLVVIARRMRAEETKDELVSAVEQAY